MPRIEMVLLCAVGVLCLLAEAWPQAGDDFVARRHALAHRQRRVIFNNDGNEVIYFPGNLAVTTENVLAQRTSPLAGSQVDSIFYCPISSGFSYFTYNTKVGTVLDHPMVQGGKEFVPRSRNITRDLIDQGTDCLKQMVEWGHANQVEIFFSMRMNDTHDAAHDPANPYPLFPPLKAQHPEWLLGSREQRPPYGQWSGMDFTHPEVRDQAFRFFQEVCQNYDVDGVELDFFRHMHYFKSVADGGVASDAERDMMTELLRRIRTMADAEGRKRGRPILIAVRVPDSVDYARAVGLDIERWLSEGLVDLLSGTCYFQLNQWEYLVNLGHKYNVPVYPALSETRVKGDGPPYRRGSLESYRARAARVWQSGADGVYLFNYFNAKSPLWREIGDPKVLARMDKTYFVTVRNGSPSSYLAEGAKFRTVPMLTPDDPLTVLPGKPVTVPLQLAEGPVPAGQAAPQVQLHLLTPCQRAPETQFNGQALGAGKHEGMWWTYPVPFDRCRPGENSVTVALPEAPAGESGQWDVEWTGTAAPGAPWTHDPTRANLVAQVQDGALLVADRGTAPGDYLYYWYAWAASPEREAVAELRVKVVSGLSSVIFSNGVACDRLVLTPDKISVYSTHAAYAMDTTDDFHTYRLVLKGQDLQVFADGKLVLDGTGKFTAPTPAGRNALQFGAASSTEVGEALWQSVRFHTGSTALFDMVVTVDYP